MLPADAKMAMEPETVVPMEEIASSLEVPVAEIPAFSLLIPSRGNCPLAILGSLLLHCGLIGLLMAIRFEDRQPPEPPFPEQRYELRVLRLTAPPLEQPVTPPALEKKAKAVAPASQGRARAGKSLRAAATNEQQSPLSQPGEPENGSERRKFRLPPVAGASPAEHTLVQPDVLPSPMPLDIRVPEVLVWAPVKAPTRQYIVPPAESKPKFSDAPPVIDFAAPDLNPGDIRILAPPALNMPLLPIPKAATSPVRAAAPDRDTAIPETALPTSRETSAGRLISVADIPLPPQALINVPPVNQVAAMKNPELPPPLPAKSGEGSGPGNGKGSAPPETPRVANTKPVTAPATPDKPVTVIPPAATVSGPGRSGAAATLENSPNPDGAGGASRTPGAAASPATGPAAGPASSGTSPAGQRIIGDLTRIERSPNGRHSSVVLGGAAATETYPEAAGVLTGKIIYTVYLQTGKGKNWILQYCLPAEAERARGVKGSVAALEAPWPFVILRPSSDKLRGDYTLVRGIVNVNGRFEQLALVTPDEAAKKDLLDPLAQWEFRPASSDGKPTPVEILLIIPHVRE